MLIVLEAGKSKGMVLASVQHLVRAAMSSHGGGKRGRRREGRGQGTREGTETEVANSSFYGNSLLG